jgi:hypothetical protein
VALSRGERGVDLALFYGVHRSTISRMKHGVRRRSCEPISPATWRSGLATTRSGWEPDIPS